MSPEPRHIELLRQEIVNLDKRRSLLTGILQALEKAAGSVSSGDSPREVIVNPKRREAHNSPPEPTEPLRVFEGSLAHVIHQTMTGAGRPISWDELREGIRLRGTTTKVDNPQSYYAAFQRLRERGYAVAYKGRITTPETLKKFMDEVAAGRAVDVVVTRHRNKWAEATLAFMRTKPEGTAKYREILDHLETLPVIGPKVKRSPKSAKSYLAGVLRRMCNRTKTLEKLDRGIYRLRPENPDDSLSVSDESDVDLSLELGERPPLPH